MTSRFSLRRDSLWFWSKVTGPDWRLFFFLGVSLLGHLLVFYLFRVDYPPVERWVPQTTQVTLLTDSNPWAARFLRDLDDRLFHLDPGASTRLAQFSIQSQAVMFRPSFAGFEIELLPGPQPEAVIDPMTLYEVGGPVLPKIAAEALAAGDPSAVREMEPEIPDFEIRVSGPLRERGFLVDRDAVRQLIEGKPGGQIKGRAGVTPQGVLRFLNVVPDTGLVVSDPQIEWSAEELDAWRRAVRFTPGAAMEWGWLELAW